MPIAFLAVLFVVGLGVAATWPGFYPKHIVVKGNSRVSRAEILARAAVARNVSIWLQNTGGMRRRIEAIPYVATARVGRVPPASIRIAIVERIPFAVLRSGDDVAVVDRSLRVLVPATGDEALPVLELGPGIDLTPGRFVQVRGAAELRDAYQTIAAHQIPVEQLDFDRYGGLVVTLKSGLRLLLGSPGGLDQKIVLANAIIAQVIGRRPRVAELDLRAPSAPVVVYR
jgi:POTRA domain-containing FtsQ-type protein